LDGIAKKNIYFQPPQQSPFVDYTVPPAGAHHNGTRLLLICLKKHQQAAIIAGTILIIIGGCVLLDDFDIIPDWDFDHLWPLALIGAGIAAIFAGSKKQPWENHDWNKTEKAKEEPISDNLQNDNNPTI
jgi:phage shock protein C